MTLNKNYQKISTYYYRTFINIKVNELKLIITKKYINNLK